MRCGWIGAAAEVGAAILFDADNHALWADQMFDARRRETCLAHPCAAISAGLVESAGCLDQHVQAHQQPECVYFAIVIDDGIVDDDRAAFWKRRERLGKQGLFLREIPVVQNMAHHDHIGFRKPIVEKVTRLKPTRSATPCPATNSSNTG